MKVFLSIRSSGTINAEGKLVITDYEVDSLKLEQGIFSGSDVEFITAQCRTVDEVIRAASDADGILNQYAPISSRVIAAYRLVFGTIGAGDEDEGDAKYCGCAFRLLSRLFGKSRREAKRNLANECWIAAKKRSCIDAAPKVVKGYEKSYKRSFAAFFCTL
jgi:hypothetical protein